MVTPEPHCGSRGENGCSAGEDEGPVLFHLLNIMEYGLFVVGLYFYLLHFIIFTKA